MERLVQDLKYSLRMLRQQRAFAFAAIAALALGIGATTAVFSVVDAVLLRPLPFPESERMVSVFEAMPSAGIMTNGASYADFEQLRQLGHRMKGVGNSYGFAHVSTIGKLIEDGARSGDRAGLQATIAEYGEYLSRVQIKYE